MGNKLIKGENKMNNTKKLILTTVVYALVMIISTLFFILLFHTPILKKLNVFFYRGCFFLVLSSIFAVVCILICKKVFSKLELEIKDAFVIFFLFFGFTLGWFVLIPVTVERSISVYMLSYMDQNDKQGITSDEFGDIFYQNYITDYGAFDKRFDEQITSGNIEKLKDGDGYVITDSGRNIVGLFRICANLFDTDKWLVYPNDYDIGYERK